MLPYRSPADVLRAAARICRVSTARLKFQRRTTSVVRARAACAYILRHEFEMSLPEIGRALGGCDHTTVMYYLRRVCPNVATMKIAGLIRDALATPEAAHA